MASDFCPRWYNKEKSYWKSLIGTWKCWLYIECTSVTSDDVISRSHCSSNNCNEGVELQCFKPYLESNAIYNLVYHLHLRLNLFPCGNFHHEVNSLEKKSRKELKCKKPSPLGTPSSIFCSIQMWQISFLKKFAYSCALKRKSQGRITSSLCWSVGRLVLQWHSLFGFFL